MIKYIFNYGEYFQKKYQKLARKNLKIKKEVEKTLKFLAQDPFYPSLKSHKVNSKNFGLKYSSRVNKDLRIIWDYNNNEINIISLLDIGSYSGRHKIYK